MKNSNTVLEESNDQELVQLVKQGYKLAFAEIERRYYHRLYQTALVILDDRYEAKKITEASLQQACKTIKGFKNECLLLTWLCRIQISKANQRRCEILQQQAGEE